jgi:hypothetical protein
MDPLSSEVASGNALSSAVTRGGAQQNSFQTAIKYGALVDGGDKFAALGFDKNY